MAKASWVNWVTGEEGVSKRNCGNKASLIATDAGLLPTKEFKIRYRIEREIFYDGFTQAEIVMLLVVHGRRLVMDGGSQEAEGIAQSEGLMHGTKAVMRFFPLN